MKIRPSFPKEYTGEVMANPWWKTRVDKERRGILSQDSHQEDNIAEYQRYSFSSDAADLSTTKTTETPPSSFLDDTMLIYSVPGADIDTKTPSLSFLDTTLNTNTGADISSPYVAGWQKQKRGGL